MYRHFICVALQHLLLANVAATMRTSVLPCAKDVTFCSHRMMSLRLLFFRAAGDGSGGGRERASAL